MSVCSSEGSPLCLCVLSVPLLALTLLALALTPFSQVCCMSLGPQMTRSWYLSEAVLPESPCPVCSSEERLLTRPQMHHSWAWAWAHPRRFPGRSPHQAQVQEGSPGIYIPAPRHYMGSPGKRWGSRNGEGVSSLIGQPKGFGAICNGIKFVIRLLTDYLSLWVPLASGNICSPRT